MRKQNQRVENYRHYLGSACLRNYEESVNHCKSEAAYLREEGYWDTHIPNSTSGCIKENQSALATELSIIKSALGNSLGCMRLLGIHYEAQSSLDLLLSANTASFRYNAFVAAKLRILSAEEPLAWLGTINVESLFLPIVSDHHDLIKFLIKHKDSFEGEYDKGKNLHSFFLRNTLLALAGDWDLLKERSELFLDGTHHSKQAQKRILDHDFYIALCNGDKKGMQIVLNQLLEPEFAKIAVYDTNIWFDFYLQLQVVLYAKIAMIHGFDLGIDSPIAPKELIEVNPLESYEDPYDFMKEFDFHQPQQVWIDRWKAKMEAGLAWREKEYKKLKNRILRFFGRGGRLIDLEPHSPNPSTLSEKKRI